MKKIALALVAAIVVWLPASAGAAPTQGHSTSFHHSIDWD